MSNSGTIYCLKPYYADLLPSFDACAFSKVQTHYFILSHLAEPCLTRDIQNKRGSVFPDLIDSRADILSKITPGHCRDGEFTLIRVVFVTGVVRGGRAEGKDAETQPVCHYCSLIQRKYTHGRKTNN